MVGVDKGVARKPPKSFHVKIEQMQMLARFRVAEGVSAEREGQARTRLDNQPGAERFISAAISASVDCRSLARTAIGKHFEGVD
jgi:hypothetical protein